MSGSVVVGPNLFVFQFFLLFLLLLNVRDIVLHAAYGNRRLSICKFSVNSRQVRLAVLFSPDLIEFCLF